MKLGVCLPNYRSPASPQAIAEVAQRAEVLGFDSVWTTDHLVVPEAYLDRFGPVFYEPLTVLAYAAGVTRRVSLGTTAIILSYRNPIVVAKTLETIDQLSGGRLIFGAASGWAEIEFRILGVPFDERGARSDEYLDIIKTLWTQEKPSFKGRFFSFSEVHFLPKPVQKPHPPIWIGGRSHRAIRRAVEHGAAWHPTYTPPEQLRADIAYMHGLSARKGRAAPPDVTLRLSIRLTAQPVLNGGRIHGTGTVQQIVEDLQTYQALGVSHIVLDFPVETAGEIYRGMETVAKEVMPKVR